jgi:hypothetical protein
MEYFIHDKVASGKERFNGCLYFFKIIVIIKFDFFLDRFMKVFELFKKEESLSIFFIGGNGDIDIKKFINLMKLFFDLVIFFFK